MITETMSRYGSIDILVNNAGITRDNLLMRMKENEWDDVINTNLKGVFLCTKAVTRQMMKQRAGRIVNIASIVGVSGNAGQANYVAAKAGVIGLTKCLSREWARFNVNANAVAFGWIETRMTQAKEEGEYIERDGKKIFVGVPKAGLGAFKAMIPMGRPGTPDEAARTILFFASSLSDYVSGQVLKVAGGWY